MKLFSDLHQQQEPLLLANVWDVASAQSAENAGYQAIGTSSAAIAQTLGYEDGEHMPFNELIFMVQRIHSSTSLPLSVDIETGFSREPLQIAKHIQTLHQLGVVGINIEDSIVGDNRTLMSCDNFCAKLSLIKKYLNDLNVKIFLNVRSDVFYLDHIMPLSKQFKGSSIMKNLGQMVCFSPVLKKLSILKR